MFNFSKMFATAKPIVDHEIVVHHFYPKDYEKINAIQGRAKLAAWSSITIDDLNEQIKEIERDFSYILSAKMYAGVLQLHSKAMTARRLETKDMISKHKRVASVGKTRPIFKFAKAAA
jgi:hypothetical protein